jgi:hypothetical protein
VPEESGVLRHALRDYVTRNTWRDPRSETKQQALSGVEVCAYSRKEDEMEYTGMERIYRGVLGRALMLGALAACISVTPVRAQNTIDGSFTLNESARLGDTVLLPGPYKFSIEAVGLIQSVRSIQQGSGHLVLVVLRPEKAGPPASIFAMASPNDREGSASELVLEPAKAGTLLETMYLEKEGLKVNFRWSTAKGKTTTIARQNVPVVTAAVRRLN